MVDTGLDYYHPDLVANLWNNPGEGSTPDGIDNDGNGTHPPLTLSYLPIVARRKDTTLCQVQSVCT